MLLKNKLLYLLKSIKKYFFIKFFLFFYLDLFIIILFRLKVYNLNNYYILYIYLLFSFILFFFWFKNLNPISLIRKILLQFSIYFLVSFSINTIILRNLLFYNTIIPQIVNTVLIILIIITSIITFYSKRQSLNQIKKEKKIDYLIKKNKPKSFAINHPIINKILNIFNKKDLFYIISIFLIISISLIIRYLLIPITALDNDEGYTYTVNLGYSFFHEISTTATGVIYSRTPMYNFFNSLILIITNSPILSLKLFNILFFAFISIFIYFFIKNLFTKKVALLAFFLININWLINSVLLAGRSYTFSIIFSFFSLYFILNLFNNNLSAKPLIKNFILSIIFIAITFFEGHIISAYHLIPLFFIAITTIIYNYNNKIKLIIISISSLAIILINLYIFIINPSFGYFLFKIFNFKPSFKFITDFGSLFSYFSVIGLLILFYTLSFSLFVKKNNVESKNIFLIAFFCIYTFLIHSLFLKNDTKSFTYFSDLIIPLLILFSYWFIYFYQKYNKILIQLSLMIILVFVSFSSFYNIINISKEKLSWRMNGRPILKQLNSIPNKAIILTDQPLISNILKPQQTTYVVFRWINDDEIANIELKQDIQINEKYATRIFSSKEKIRFKNYIQNNIDNNYILKSNQLFSIYSGNPLVMDLEHLKQIINSTKEKEVYLVFEQTAFDKRARARNPELYDFLFNNMIIIDKYSLFKNVYDDQTILENNLNIQTLAMIKLN